MNSDDAAGFVAIHVFRSEETRVRRSNGILAHRRFVPEIVYTAVSQCFQLVRLCAYLRAALRLNACPM